MEADTYLNKPSWLLLLIGNSEGFWGKGWVSHIALLR